MSYLKNFLKDEEGQDMVAVSYTHLVYSTMSWPSSSFRKFFK